MNKLDSTECYPINKKRLNEYITANIESPREGATYNFGFAQAVIPSKGVICTEIVAREFEEAKISLDIWENGEGAIAIFPKLRARFTEEELMALTDAPITIAEFVKERRGYNTRLQSNEWAVNEWLEGR